MVTVGGVQQARALSNCSAGDAALDGEEQAFLGLINAYRTQRGLASLAISAGLNRSAAWMVNDMATTGRFGHTDSLGRNPWARLGDCGNPTYGGENLAAGTDRSSASSAFELLRNSPSHNAVMLAPEFRLIGIARQFSASSPYGWYWATDFGNGDTPAETTPTAIAAPPPPPPPPPPVVATAVVPVPKPESALPAPSAQVAAQTIAQPQPQPEPAAVPDPVRAAESPAPMLWQGDDQLAAAILGSVAFEVGDGLSAMPRFNGSESPSGA